MTPTASSASIRSISRPFYRALAASLAAIVVTLAGAVAESHSAPSSPRLVLVAETALGEGSSAIDGRIRIEARFRTSTSGTFAIGGAISDTGTLKAVRRVAGGRMQLTEVLAGELGTIRIRATRSCTGRSGTWQVLSGSRAYKGLSGGGAASGGPRCAAATYPVRAIYAGTVRTPTPPPPPPLAQPGPFGGGTSQRKEVLLTVDADGRTFSGLRFDVDAPCTGPTALSTTRASFSFLEPQAIGADGRFSLSATATSSTRTVSGRFTSKTSVEVTATLSTRLTTAQGTYPCSAEVTWSASLPPPAAVPGKYCGFTLQGPGVCFDVSESGREVTRFTSAVVVRCFPGGVPPSEIEVSLTYTGSVPIGGHLGFASSRLPVEGLISGTASFLGLLDPSGATASGAVSLGPATLDHEGTRYQCHPAVGRWEAKR